MVNENTDDCSQSSSTTRRAFLTAAGAAGVTGTAGCLGGITGSGGGSATTLEVLTWEEYAELKEDIESRLDVTVNFTKSTSSSKMFSGWKSGQDAQYDIAVPNNNYVPKMVDADLVAPVPSDAVSNYDSTYDKFQSFAESQFTKDGTMYGVPIRFGWYGYSYDSRKIPTDHEKSYDVLFSDSYEGTDLSGQIIMYDNHFKAMSAAALYLGYRDAFTGSKITLSEKQIDEVKQTMKEQKSLLQGYIAADPTYIKSFKQGNFVIGQSGRNEIVEMKANGTDWAEMAAPKEGSLAWFESAVVSKKSDNKDMAWKVINEFIAPKLGAKLGKVGYSPSVNPKIQEHLSDSENEMFGRIDPSRLDSMIPFKAVENEDKWLTAWEEIKSA
ncbi:extracellular solute-binding protein [Halogeometricum borinquense]|uniref:Spermidine/putrescine ABC transporter substrate-binding protein n=2 Tax=Halogeometricum borinquense TaxID=60847 RepID=E4NLK2_HALBP|nr:PotD/PotF family extracellular solute-binding protein [Halogeometricum borinquense]ADQ67205.1 spermidine/putrescine-binding periplasmic protein [Halogeometricum borinquense DSM 11551]ELY29752.1 spermidine/putrescine ABC transporter substrate-binding protein [Halogeometricum borinquense DSM 11551]QIB74560.1 extracellular solute-binding protein [Halogeometricum borinquense]QIQ76495.1 extracellular solute-binding protein [Halogeometricum borinquense]RYJ13842.1 extracellular solute-binding prot